MYINHHHRNQPPVNHKPVRGYDIDGNLHHLHPLLDRISKDNGQAEYLHNGFDVVSGLDSLSCNIEEPHMSEVEDVGVKILVDKPHGLQILE
jgi:hypothetical protein